MRVMWKAAGAAVLLIAATTIEIGCGETYRPVATPLPVTTGNPSGFETEVVLSCCLDPHSVDAVGGIPSSKITAINVSGDTNAGNKVMGNVVGNGASAVDPSSAPLAFNYSRSVVFSTNTATDSVTEVTISPSTAGFSATNNTISLEKGSAPIGMSFQYFGATYTQDYVVNSGNPTGATLPVGTFPAGTSTCPGAGSVTAIAQASGQVNANICVGAAPVFAWIYKDQTKVFVLDKRENQVYVVSASTYKWKNRIPVGAAPIKAAQSSDGNFIYVLNSGDDTISIIDGRAESVVGTIRPTLEPGCLSICSSPLIDIALNSNFNDTTKNTQSNHIWLLHANGTVSVYDGTGVGAPTGGAPVVLPWITSLATTSTVLPTGLPTNLALMRDGTQAFVGVKNTDQVVAIDTSKLANGLVTENATTPITVGVHRGTLANPLTATLMSTVTDTTTGTVTKYSKTVPVEVTVPTVTYVAVSRGGSTADLSKAYVTTETSTTYYCYDYTVSPTNCSNSDVWADGNPIVISIPVPTAPAPYLVEGCSPVPLTIGQMSCSDLYNGTAVVTAAANGATPINTYVTTVPAPAKVTNCDTGNPATGEYDGQKNCPAMVPTLVLGRS